MPRLTFLAGVFLVSLGLVPLMTTSRAADISAFQSSLERRYTTPHSLGNNYRFDPRDGWQAVNVTNLQYKYSQAQTDEDEDVDGPVVPRAHSRRSTKKSTKKASKKTSKKTNTKAASKATTTSSASGVGGLVGSVKSIVGTMKAAGDSEPVTITWYTGHDLENPSCWSNPTWAPTDDSMVSAVTLDGWTNRPQCFKFVELCHTNQKCVFVRIVDTCAGCAPGSKHVDLTKAAFSSLADLNEGTLTVQMRPATDPLEGWLESLWGPKA
ncbi:uncharacterized protein C8Q71DRAFT_17963 [Rhodofomes roseus]|uniref:Uncharacterized protein n=1 Tax=Rhodofomes roseus TaxID=34475 RepID=A0A4Y9YBV0_9APHY|nr:uncharacterized protein C8Q71DRAFT_17963 [Rhodofomes roseus]KAH9843889.1 hypothetical protein C8Q71DRAFT_17963 [Rhodofomes roseus]TFY59805.1 hypothetical protein EVJ58_g5547 [Rhodofomes roseus]